MLRPAALLVATLMLTGCVPHEPTVTPAPEPSTAPVFASDEEALAAATEAYAKYLEVSDAIANEGGADSARIASLVSEDRLEDEIRAFGELAASGNHQEGRSTFDGAQLQHVTEEGGGVARVAFYVCLDQSTARFVDTSGVDITPSGIARRSPFEVTLRVQNSADPSIVLEGMERWSGAGIC